MHDALPGGHQSCDPARIAQKRAKKRGCKPIANNRLTVSFGPKAHDLITNRMLHRPAKSGSIVKRPQLSHI
jgi:hypothetical protein